MFRFFIWIHCPWILLCYVVLLPKTLQHPFVGEIAYWYVLFFCNRKMVYFLVHYLMTRNTTLGLLSSEYSEFWNTPIIDIILGNRHALFFVMNSSLILNWQLLKHKSFCLRCLSSVDLNMKAFEPCFELMPHNITLYILIAKYFSHRVILLLHWSGCVRHLSTFHCQIWVAWDISLSNSLQIVSFFWHIRTEVVKHAPDIWTHSMSNFK